MADEVDDDQSPESGSASIIAAQLSVSAPAIETFQALIIFGLQEDFISPQGGLPVDTSSGFVDRILKLVPKFRDRAGHIIWVKSELTAEASVDAFVGAGRTVKKYFGSLDKELDHTNGPDNMPPGAQYNTSEFPEHVKAVVKPDADLVIEKRYCSAFTSAEFIMTLHRNLIGDVFICGAISESTLYAFARDAASRAVRLHVIEDCLGYRNRSRNDYALRRMVLHMEASRILSADIHQELDLPLTQTSTADDLTDMLNDKMKVDVQSSSSKTRIAGKREPPSTSSKHSRSERLVLPSGELKKASRTRIYVRNTGKSKSAESESQSNAGPPNDLIESSTET